MSQEIVRSRPTPMVPLGTPLSFKIVHTFIYLLQFSRTGLQIKTKLERIRISNLLPSKSTVFKSFPSSCCSRVYSLSLVVPRPLLVLLLQQKVTRTQHRIMVCMSDFYIITSLFVVQGATMRMPSYNVFVDL